eukprot:Pgem_evm1s34
MLPRMVPWINPGEWLDTFYHIFSPNLADQRFALERLEIWSCKGRVPSAVECTKALLLVIVDDQGNDSPFNLRLSYSMAIT